MSDATTPSMPTPDPVQSSLATKFQDLLRQEGFGDIQTDSTARTMTVSATKDKFSVFFHIMTGPRTKSNVATAVVLAPLEAPPAGGVILPTVPIGSVSSS
jgi:hypothetical protein